MPESSRLNPEITNTIPVNRRMPAGMSLRIFSSVVFNTGCSSLALWRAALSRPTPDHVLTSHAGLDGGSVSFPRTFPCQTAAAVVIGYAIGESGLDPIAALFRSAVINAVINAVISADHGGRMIAATSTR